MATHLGQEKSFSHCPFALIFQPQEVGRNRFFSTFLLHTPRISQSWRLAPYPQGVARPSVPLGADSMTSSGQPQEPVREILSHVEPEARTPGQREARQEGWVPRTARAARAREGQEEGVCTARRLGPLLAEGARQLLRVRKGTWKLQSRERKGVSKPLRQRGSGHPEGRGGGQSRPEPHAGSSFPPIQQGSSLTRWNPSLQKKPTPGKGALPPWTQCPLPWPRWGARPPQREGGAVGSYL